MNNNFYWGVFMKNKEKLDRVLSFCWTAGFVVSVIMIGVSLILSVILGSRSLSEGIIFGFVNAIFFALFMVFFSKMRKVFAAMKKGSSLIKSIFPHLIWILIAFIGGVQLRLLNQELMSIYQLYFSYVQDKPLSIWKCMEFSDNIVVILYTFGVLLSAFELFRLFRGRNRDEALGISSLEMRKKIAGKIHAFLNILLGFNIITFLVNLVVFIISISRNSTYFLTDHMMNISVVLFRYVLVFSVIFLLIGIMRHVEKDAPFALEFAPKLRLLGIIYGVYFIFAPAVSMIGQIIRNNQLFQGEKLSLLSLQEGNINLTIAPVNLIICVILLVLANIFSHASELQKQSDETL